jgi:hypothetical protein
MAAFNWTGLLSRESDHRRSRIRAAQGTGQNQSLEKDTARKTLLEPLASESNHGHGQMPRLRPAARHQSTHGEIVLLLRCLPCQVAAIYAGENAPAGGGKKQSGFAKGLMRRIGLIYQLVRFVIKRKSGGASVHVIDCKRLL